MQAIQRFAALGAVASMLLAAPLATAFAAPDRCAGLPQEFDAAACQQLVLDAGRMIAWVRWELGAPEQSVVMQFEEQTPDWIIALTDRWMADAYHWEPTDDQVREALGDDTAASRAEALTTPQTISVWMRRIARTCREQHV